MSLFLNKFKKSEMLIFNSNHIKWIQCIWYYSYIARSCKSHIEIISMGIHFGAWTNEKTNVWIFFFMLWYGRSGHKIWKIKNLRGSQSSQVEACQPTFCVDIWEEFKWDTSNKYKAFSQVEKIWRWVFNIHLSLLFHIKSNFILR